MFLVVLRNSLHVILHPLYPPGQSLQLFKVFKKLEFKKPRYLDGLVLPLYNLDLLVLTLLRHSRVVVVLYRVLVEAVIHVRCHSTLTTLHKGLLRLKRFILVELHYVLKLLPLLPIVLVLEEQQVCVIVFKVEGVLQLLGLLSCCLLQLGELKFSLLDDSIDIHETVIVKDLLLLLQDLGSAMKQYLLILVLGQ